MENTFSNLDIENTVISQCTSGGNGGAISKVSELGQKKISSQSSYTIYLKDVTISKCTSGNNGGGVYLYGDTMVADNVTFDFGYALNGGGLYSSYMDTYITSGSLTNLKFTNNYAKNAGGAIRLAFDESMLGTRQNNYFNNNTAGNAAHSNNSFGTPTQYRYTMYDVLVDVDVSTTDVMTDWISNATKTKVAYQVNGSFNAPASGSSRMLSNNYFSLEQKSGNALKQIMAIDVLNADGTIASYIENEAITMGLTADPASTSSFVPYISGNNIYYFSKGRIAVKADLIMIGERGATATLTMSTLLSGSNMLIENGLILSQPINIVFGNCTIGDVYNTETKTCDPCAVNTYTLDDPDGAICQKCVENAQCLGGSKIAPNPGYWRYDIDSKVFLECQVSSACLGGFIDEKYYPQGICVFPNVGNVCDACEPPYAKFGSSSNCLNCKTETLYYVKFAGFFVIQLIGIVYCIRCTLEKNEKMFLAKERGDDKNMKKKLKSEDYQSTIMKIMVNYLQITSVIIKYPVNWPSTITDSVDGLNNIIPDIQSSFSSDCFIILTTGNPAYVEFLAFIVNIVQPFICWLTIVFVYYLTVKIGDAIKKRKTKFENVKSNMTLLFVIVGFITQPGVL